MVKERGLMVDFGRWFVETAKQAGGPGPRAILSFLSVEHWRWG